jgi:hypothetical protein
MHAPLCHENLLLNTRSHVAGARFANAERSGTIRHISPNTNPPTGCPLGRKRLFRSLVRCGSVLVAAAGPAWELR